MFDIVKPVPIFIGQRCPGCAGCMAGFEHAGRPCSRGRHRARSGSPTPRRVCCQSRGTGEESALIGRCLGLCCRRRTAPADVAPRHHRRPVPGLPHDVPLVLASVRDRRGERVTGEQYRIGHCGLGDALHDPRAPAGRADGAEPHLRGNSALAKACCERGQRDRRDADVAACQEEEVDGEEARGRVAVRRDRRGGVARARRRQQERTLKVHCREEGILASYRGGGGGRCSMTGPPCSFARLVRWRFGAQHRRHEPRLAVGERSF